MFIRATAIQAATALLYLGPLLAGLAGFGWATLLPFVLLFTLRLMLLRPKAWRQACPEWHNLPVLLGMMTQILTQILLVTVLIAIGRGFSGVLDHAPSLHGFLPVAISLAAVSLLAVSLHALRMLPVIVTGEGVLTKAAAMSANRQPQRENDARPMPTAPLLGDRRQTALPNGVLPRG